MELIQGVIVAVRTIKAELGISPSHKVSLLLHPADETQAALLEENRSLIMTLARLESLTLGPARGRAQGFGFGRGPGLSGHRAPARGRGSEGRTGASG